MKLFASLDTVLPPSPSSHLVGRQVANGTFLEALWRYGDFDGYHFFAGDRHDACQFRETYEALWSQLGILDRVRVFSRFELIDQLHSTEYHVFHQSDFVTGYGDLCTLRSRHARVRFPVTAPTHTLSYPSFLQTYLRLLLFGPETYDAIICTSEAGRAALEAGFEQVAASPLLSPWLAGLQRVPRQRHVIIPLGIPLEHFRKTTPALKAAARKILGWSPQETVCLSLGRFSESDKYDLLPLLVAFKKAFEGMDTPDQGEMILVLAGARQGSNYPERLEQIAASMGLAGRVKTYVDVDLATQQRLYQASDVFVSPSDNLQETFGLTLLEAMASGLPVIVSDWDGYKDLVLEGVTGMRVPTYVAPCDGELGELGPVSYQRPWHLAVAQATAIDVPALARALSSLLLDPEKRAVMGEAGHAHAQNFGWQRIIPRYLELFAELKTLAAADRREAPQVSPFGGRPFARFPAHASRVLSPSQPLSLTARGTLLLSVPDARAWYQELDPLLDATLLRHICAEVRRGACLGEAVRAVAEAHEVSEERALYQLMWAIKQDFVQVGGGVPGS